VPNHDEFWNAPLMPDSLGESGGRCTRGGPEPAMERYRLPGGPVTVPAGVLEGIDEVQASGVTNMFLRPVVVEVARMMGHDEAAEWIESNPSAYNAGVFRGFTTVADRLLDLAGVVVVEGPTCARCGADLSHASSEPAGDGLLCLDCADARCPDCGVPPGSLHADGCDVERCRHCGLQAIGCPYLVSDADRFPWTGEWPGTEEARELGFMIAPNVPDLNRLIADGTWDQAAGKWRARDGH